MALAANEELGAVLESIGNMGLNLRDSFVVNQWADIDPGIEAVADFQLLTRFNEAPREIIVNIGLDQKAVGADASLSGMPVFAQHCALHRGLQIGIIKHNKRRIAAKL